MRLHLAHSCVALSAVAALLVGSCYQTKVPVSSVAATPASPNETVQVATVPSGRTFHVRLDRPLTSESVVAGQEFTARLDEPLYASDGRPIAPRGAVLRGHVIEVDRQGLNRIVLQFDGLVLDGKFHAMRAHVIQMDSARVVASESTHADVLSVDVLPRLPAGVQAPPVGGGPRSDSIPVEVPRDAVVELYLTEPFVAVPQTSAGEVQNAGEVDRSFRE
jgi:hypothetical protein